MKETPLDRLMNEGLEKVVRSMNPWWRGDAILDLQPFKRWANPIVHRKLTTGPTKAVALRGPRQVGKTTLVKQIVDQLLRDGVAPQRIMLLQFDELEPLKKISIPIVLLAYWFADNILGKTLSNAANEKEPAILLLDEVQNLRDWDVQLKNLVDISGVKMLVTGSSALRIEAGRDSLAGRITTVEMGPLLLREIAEIRKIGSVEPHLAYNGMSPLKEKEFWLALRAHGERHRAIRDEAFRAFSERGTYPVAHVNPNMPWEELADTLNETVIRRAIQHDLRMGPRGAKRDEHLLEEVFRLACRYVGQTPTQAFFVNEIKNAMNAPIAWTRIWSYLKFLDGTLLLRLIEPLEIRLKKKRGTSKVVICDHALRAAWLQEVIPLTPDELQKHSHLSDLAGRIAESAAGYFLSSIINLGVTHFPERETEPEVDYVLTVGEQRIPMEIKYRSRLRHADTLGLRAFIEKSDYNAPFGILVTLDDQPGTDDPRIVSLPLSTLLMMR